MKILEFIYSMWIAVLKARKAVEKKWTDEDMVRFAQQCAWADDLSIDHYRKQLKEFK